MNLLLLWEIIKIPVILIGVVGVLISFVGFSVIIKNFFKNKK